MDSLLPSVSASAFTLLVVGALYLHLYAQYGESYLRTWALSWFLYAARNGLQLATLSGLGGPVQDFLYQAAAIWSGYLLLLGTYRFLGRQGHRRWLTASVGATGWVAFAQAAGLSFPASNLPLFSVLGAVHAWTGVALFAGGLGATRGGLLTAAAFVLLGVHRASYPFLRPLAWYAPWGYQVGSVLVLLVAIGIVEVFFEHARQRLQRAKRRFKGLIEGAGDAILVCDPHRRAIVDVNRAACELLGRTRDELLGQDPAGLGLTLPDPSAPSPPRGPTVEALVRARGGSQVPVEVRYTALEAEGQEHVLAVARDVRDRRAAEAELRAREEKFRAVFDAVNDAIFLHDPATGRILDVNARMLELYRCTREDALSATPERFSSGEPGFDAPTALAYMHRAAGGERLLFEWRARAQDGELFWVEVNMARAQIRGENLLVVTVRDTGERRRLEAQIRDAQKLESLGLLAGGIAHDFNNLLTGVLGHSDLALQDGATTPAVRKHLEKVQISALRAAELTRQLLAYSGKGRFVVEAVSLTDLTREMVQLLEVSTSKKCRVLYGLAPDLPPVEADPAQLRQVVMNLVINASEAVGDGGGVVSVSTGAGRFSPEALAHNVVGEPIPGGDYVYLEVADTGCGMSPETLGRIFEPFFTTKFTGRGLGLAAVAGIVRGHRGALRVTSEPGRGTTFTVLLPAAPGASRGRAPATAAANVWRGTGTVLVVDDEETVRDLARDMLLGLGFTVLTASDGAEALAVFAARAEEVTAVLLDMTMPRMDGAETFRALRQLRSDVRILFTSGFNEPAAASCLAGTERAAGFLQKPYRVQELAAALRSALGE